MFMAEVAAIPTQHVFIPRRLYKLLARPSAPRYENVSTKMDSPRLAAAAGQGFRPLPKDISSGVDCIADFRIGILPCHDMWFKRVTPTAVLSTPPYFFVPSATPAVPGGEDIMVTSGYPCAATRTHLEDVYGVDNDSMVDALKQYKALALANNLSASAVTQYMLAHKQLLQAHAVDGRMLWNNVRAFIQAQGLFVDEDHSA